MFSLFKKEKETKEETELTDLVKVDNLKAYVVEGYKKEEELKAEIQDKTKEIDRLNKKLLDLDALKVVLAKKEQDIRDLKIENQKIETLESKLEYANNQLNEQRIANRELINRREKLNTEAYNQASEKFRKTFVESVEKHKGNLSKAMAIEIAELSVKEKADDNN
ncbi:hypothetical protein IV75_GL000907 [Carnobacterium maltaromaticum]|uniref:hypothetical protein n=1 Tax=Carnobacterium maltaromaticum TaxID=2751 RepID=UPI00070549FF|nr:hypothetical protein [Carnobacterium maltaromaticum]KRN84197.1 hypothetical protein IV75_GL000907 [Carnobacterium maltaromaticum]